MRPRVPHESAPKPHRSLPANWRLGLRAAAWGIWLALAAWPALAPAPAWAQGIEFLGSDPGTDVPIRIVAVIAPEVVRGGEFTRVQIEVEIGAPWYIYALRPDPGGGPPSRMRLDPGMAQPTGRFQESRPEEQLDKETLSPVRIHKGRASFWTDVFVPPGTKPGPFAVTGELSYAACNGKICLPLRHEAFRAEGTVEPGASRQNTRPNPIR